MSALEGSGFQEASEQERARRDRELKRAREAAPAHLRAELRQKPVMYGGLFPTGVEVQLRAVAAEEGYTFEAEKVSEHWLSIGCSPVETPTCQWCGETYDEHREPTLGGPVARMPCLGLKSHFKAREPAVSAQPSVSNLCSTCGCMSCGSMCVAVRKHEVELSELKKTIEELSRRVAQPRASEVLYK